MFGVRQKYQEDATFKGMVNMMVGMMHQCRYTPSEMREASLLASIMYQEQCMSRVHCVLEAGRHKRVIDHLRYAWEAICPGLKGLK